MRVFNSNQSMIHWSKQIKSSGETIGLVPTMGFLHDGHASLMRMLRPKVDKLVVSIFVNPLQFGENEDLDTYPRDLEGDKALCEAQGVDALFTPTDFYPPGFCTSVSVHGLTDGLCGAKRPGHFEGVATVVTRLFNVIGCDFACFGEKDWQQLTVINRFTQDLGLRVSIVPAPLQRAADGLAMSSRNTYLTKSQRQRALSLNRALRQLQQECKKGNLDTKSLIESAKRGIDCDRLDYLEIVDALELTPLTNIDRPARALVAAFYGTSGRVTRLIDNVGVGPELTWT